MRRVPPDLRVLCQYRQYPPLISATPPGRFLAKAGDEGGSVMTDDIENQARRGSSAPREVLFAALSGYAAFLALIQILTIATSLAGMTLSTMLAWAVLVAAAAGGWLVYRGVGRMLAGQAQRFPTRSLPRCIRRDVPGRWRSLFAGSPGRSTSPFGCLPASTRT